MHMCVYICIYIYIYMYIYTFIRIHIDVPWLRRGSSRLLRQYLLPRGCILRVECAIQNDSSLSTSSFGLRIW